MLVLRKSTLADLEAMAQIASDAKAFLKRCGVSQWQKGAYPCAEDFARDMDLGIGYVVEEDGRVIAACAVTDDDEPAYRGLMNGSWRTPVNARYATIHRCAVLDSCRGRGVIGFLFGSVASWAEGKGLVSVRIDTHPDNKAMQRALEKAGFVRCGDLVLVSGEEKGDRRLGYERVLVVRSLEGKS